jgi:large subunit ribosomal protein L10
MSKKIKELELSALRKSIGGVKDFVILEPVKVDAATDFEFRKKLREKKCKVQLVKNSLARKIFEEGGLKIDSWAGPTLLIWGADSVKELGTAVDGVLKELKKDPKAPEKFKEKTAVADGQLVSLAVAKTLPTRKEAIGGVLDAILGPGASLAAALVGPATQLAGILKAIEEKAPAAGAAEAPAVEAPVAG